MSTLPPRTAWCTRLLALAIVGTVLARGASSPAPSWLVHVEYSPRQPRSGQPVTITAQVNPSIAAVTLEYQLVEPGAYIELKDSAYNRGWVRVAMARDSRPAFPNTFGVTLPGSLQQHRRLVRYRLSAATREGGRFTSPGKDQPPNYAYFVYDGVPPWTGAIQPGSTDPNRRQPLTFSSEAMSRVQVYHFLARKDSVENAGWRERQIGSDYRYTGTLVVDGEVFDHTGFRARGGVWRYEMGKNMWKFSLPEPGLAARDDFGQPYPVRWTKVNLRSCIQQGDYGHRGEQGMFESVGFRLFNLAGVPAPGTHWIHLRIIDEPAENPADQYRGDFWGLYLAIENEDGRFLQAHDLPDGNLYKMENGSGILDHAGAGAPTDRSDLDAFIAGYTRGDSPDSWWRSHVNLPDYYSYRAICEGIHHYDIADGKNYDYYHHPTLDRWTVVPWDIDLTWANNMYGSGEEPFRRRVLTRRAFAVEYQNRLREIRDLLFNPEQTGRLIDEYAAVIWDPGGAPSLVEADRRKWDYHPSMRRGFKAGQGLFYRIAPSRDFPGMLELMKRWVTSRGAWIDRALLNDPTVPRTPSIQYVGPGSFPPDQLRFRASEYQGPSAYAGLRWRLAEVTRTNAVPSGRPTRGLYEITPLWITGEGDGDAAASEIRIPPGLAQPGHTYRVRVRMKDTTGRWSHWSPPVEFTPGRQG